MSFQAYIDNIRAKTGKGPEDFARLAREAGLSTHGPIVAWLKSEFGLGHGHANAIAGVLLKSEQWKAPPDTKLGALFSGSRAGWHAPVESLVAAVRGFGQDVDVQANETYVNLLRGKKKFGIVQPGGAERLDVGIKLKGQPPEGRLEAAGTWNAMVTHRVRVNAPAELDAALVEWLRRAYSAA